MVTFLVLYCVLRLFFSFEFLYFLCTLDHHNSLLFFLLKEIECFVHPFSGFNKTFYCSSISFL